MTPQTNLPAVADRAAFAFLRPDPDSAPPPAARPGRPGRPTDYTDELGQAICDRLAEGETLSSICEADEMPASRTVRRWASTKDHPFSPLYTLAREVGYHKMADDLLDIADDGRNDWVLRRKENGETFLAVDKDHIQRSRLMIDTRKWLVSKALPKLYGDKIAVEGNPDNPVQTVSRIEFVVIDPKKG